jgi:hypothetical protein
MPKCMIKCSIGSRRTESEVIKMADKSLTDLRTFLENVNKKDQKHNGKKVRFAFVKRKRR